MKLISILQLFMSISLMSFGQSSESKAEPKVSMAITGQLMVSGNEENIFLNLVEEGSP